MDLEDESILSNNERLEIPRVNSFISQDEEEGDELDMMAYAEAEDLDPEEAFFYECLSPLDDDSYEYHRPHIAQVQLENNQADNKTKNESLGFKLKSNEIEVIKTSMGGDKLIYMGFMYTRQKKSSDKVRWRCTKRIVGCMGALMTSFNLEYAVNSVPHNHGPDYLSIELTKWHNFVRERALNSDDRPCVIYQDVLAYISDEAKAYFPTKEAIERNVRRLRNWKLDMPPKRGHHPSDTASKILSSLHLIEKEAFRKPFNDAPVNSSSPPYTVMLSKNNTTKKMPRVTHAVGPMNSQDTHKSYEDAACQTSPLYIQVTNSSGKEVEVLLGKDTSFIDDDPIAISTAINTKCKTPKARKSFSKNSHHLAQHGEFSPERESEPFFSENVMSHGFKILSPCKSYTIMHFENSSAASEKEPHISSPKNISKETTFNAAKTTTHSPLIVRV